MDQDKDNYQAALRDFNQLRLKASLQEALSKLFGKSNELLSFEEVAQKLKLTSRKEHGIKDISLKAIVGSVGRYHDFNRQFLPLQSNEAEKTRWARVKAAIDDPGGAGWPPIDVYKIGEAYFVLDGNHRVSVARQEGFTHIQANVVELKTDVPITPDLNMDDLIVKSEYAEFLRETGIRDVIQDIDLLVSIPGQYTKLFDHIEVHRYFMGIEQQREIPYSDALANWYETIYRPIIDPLGERGLLRYFPGRTLTDLYLWISEHRVDLENELGWQLRAETVIEELVFSASSAGQQELRETGAWRKSRLVERYTDHLFKDVLIPIDRLLLSSQAIQQGFILASKENCHLHGLHIKGSIKRAEDVELEESKKIFASWCSEVGVGGSMAVVTGDATKQILNRSLLTDLVILKVQHPPENTLSRSGAGLRTIIHKSARPILALPGNATSLMNALVAYDGSVKAKEALYMAAYLAERWGTKLTIASLEGKEAEKNIEFARKSLEFYELPAEYQIGGQSAQHFLNTIQERELDLVIMGSYSGNPFNEVIIGSMVNTMLQLANVPLMICR